LTITTVGRSIRRDLAHRLAREAVGLAAGGAVADGDQLHAVLLDQPPQLAPGPVLLVQVDVPVSSSAPVRPTTASLQPVR
jgi:hypothetical protein